jgi:hypothetical protein
MAVGIPATDVASLLKIRADHPILNPKEFGDIVQELGPAGYRLRIGGQSMFTIRATARLKQPDGKLSDFRRTVAALVKINFPGNAAKKAPGFEIIRWFDRT